MICLMSLCQSVLTVLPTRLSSHVEPVVRWCVLARIGISVIAFTLVMMAAMKIPLSVATATGQTVPCAGMAASV